MSVRVVRSRRVGALGAGLVAGAVLAGCATTALQSAPAAATRPADATAAPAASTSAPSSGGSTTSPAAPSADLTAGLLPAEAFGAGATVHRFTLADLSDWDHWGDHWGDGTANVVPPECRAAMDQAATQFTDVQDAAGEWATAGDVRSVEVLAVPATPVDAVAQLQAVAAACSAASVSDGDGHHGNASVSIQPLSGVPDGMAAFSLTWSGSWSGGTWSSTGLVGVAQDGDRVLALAQMSWDDGNGGSPDQASFLALLQHAYQVQADALD